MNDPLNQRREVLAARGVSKRFEDGELKVEVLKNIDFSVKAGEQVAIIGASGSGKSTLLHLLGGLASPSEGEIYVDGHNMAALNPAAQGELRNQALGFVYQFHHLLAEFTALENVAMPLLIRRMDEDEALARAEDLLDKVGLKNRVLHKPGELSGGERQRAAVARALVTEPKCVLADEPTGNLDTKIAEQIHALMLELNQALGTSLVMVTHDLELAGRMQRQWKLERGQLHSA